MLLKMKVIIATDALLRTFFCYLEVGWLGMNIHDVSVIRVSLDLHTSI